MALFVGLVLVVLLPICAFGVDLGMQRVVRRDMQAVADSVALDMARGLDGRSSDELAGEMASLRDDSLARNSDSLGKDLEVGYQLGSLDTGGEFVPGTEPPTAVRVTAAAAVDFAFASGSGGATRVAVAEADSYGCFSLGSYALAIRSGNSALLGPLIGDALSTTLVGYQGLANAGVSLLGIAAALDVGTVEGLADIHEISVGDFYLAVADALTNAGDTANAELLQAIALGIGPLPDLDLGHVIDAGQGAGSALDANVNVLDLVTGAAFVANGENFVSVPDLGVNLGLAEASLTNVKIIQEPVVHCGRPRATHGDTSQVTLTLKAGLNVGIPLVANVTGGVTLTLKVAHASATLDELDCGSGDLDNPDSMSLTVASSLLAPSLRFDLNVRALLGIVSIPASLSVQPAEQASTTEVDVSLPPSQASVASGSVGLAGTPVMGGGVLGGMLDDVLSAVVTPVAAAVDGLVAGPLSDLLGLNVAGVDVFGYPRPVCGYPTLRG